jgi:ADP-ribose pyrophosphatase YjhB (NUDIX family)
VGVRVACRAVDDLLPYEEYAAKQNRKRCPAGVLLHDRDSRVLLVRTTYAPPGINRNWTIPGGAGKAGELPVVTAARELREELGLARQPGALLAVSHIPANGPMPEGIAFVFDGGLVTEEDIAAIRLVDGEIAEIGMFTLEEAAERVTVELAGRLRAALSGLATGRVIWCMSGEPIAD